MNQPTSAAPRTAAAASDAAAPSAALPNGRSAALPPQPISAEVLAEKYAKGDETTLDDVRSRVARALAEAEPADQREHWQARFALIEIGRAHV